MTEEAFLRYRLAVVERMPDSPSKKARIVAIQSRMQALKLQDARISLAAAATDHKHAD